MNALRRLALLGVFVFTVGCAPTPIQSNVRPADTSIERPASEALKPKAATQTEALAALHRGEWPAYAGTYASAKYSPLGQINAANVATLTIAWRWTSADHGVRATTAGIDPSMIHQGTPIMVNGVLYTSTSLSQVAAIDAATGQTKWVFDPGSYKFGMPTNLGWIHRGVAYWRDGADERIVMLTGHAFLIALDAKTGRPLEDFGTKGLVDLAEGLARPAPSRRLYGHTSPPVIVRDVIVVGSSVLGFPVRESMPVGDVRGFDIRTGRHLWTFRAVPGPGEFGHETWENDSWKTIGNTNVWTLMSADEELGYVYLPFSPPANDYYGGHRHGDNLFSDALVCLEARTGKRIWHYQITRHDIWDYDLPAAPNLIDVTVDGRRVKAVAQVTKQGHVFAFDRVTGTPLWPIEDRPVPQSSVPGEKTAATQPFPTRPAPVEIQGVRTDDLIDLTPEVRQAAQWIVDQYDHGPLYTPPSERGTILMPGVGGGPSWSGAGWDPETGMYYVTTVRWPFVVKLRTPSGKSGDRYVGSFSGLAGTAGLPLLKPPWGSVVAIDMATGEHRWRSPVGSGKAYAGAPERILTAAAAFPELAKAPERLGWPARSFVLVTKSLLLVVQQGYQNNQRRRAPPLWDKSGTSTTSSRASTPTTRPAAASSRRSPCRPTRAARR